MQSENSKNATETMPDVGPAGIRANIEYYKALKRRAANEFKQHRDQLKFWEQRYEDTK